MKKNSKKLIKWCLKNKFLIAVWVIFIFELFLRFYQMDIKNPFGYDQVDNAWAAKDLIVNHKFPLVGMVAKANSGIYIGPLYYYYVALFYLITNLDPIASGLIAGVTSALSFWVLYILTKKIFNKEAALLALIINTFNFNAIFYLDRIQWPVNFLPIIGLTTFYLLYKIITGDVKKIPLLAIITGFAFHIHFTAIFIPIIIILSLPFFPRNKESLKYILISMPVFLIFLIPNLIYSFQHKSYNSNFMFYINMNFHGFHLTRFFQLTKDAFIQFDPYIFFEKIKPIKFIIVPLFIFVFLKHTKKTSKFKLVYLVILWYLVPWIVFTTYSGELSDYYFAITRFLSLVIIAYLICLVWQMKLVTVKILIILLLLGYSVFNFSLFFPYKDKGLKERQIEVFHAIEQSRRIEFQIGVPESYLYYYYMRQKKGVEVY